MITEIFKVVVEYKDGSNEIYPRIYHKQDAAKNVAALIKKLDDEVANVRIYRERPDDDSFRTKDWIDC